MMTSPAEAYSVELSVPTWTVDEDGEPLNIEGDDYHETLFGPTTDEEACNRAFSAIVEAPHVLRAIVEAWDDPTPASVRMRAEAIERARALLPALEGVDT